MISLHLKDLTATQALGMALGRSLPAGSVLLLEGDLGTGKTTLVQSLGQALGITDPIVSPTFSLINEYPEGRIPLYHLDLYRLQPGEVADLHLEDYWHGQDYPAGIMAIEWPDRLPDRPADYLRILLQHQTVQSRQAQLIPVGQFAIEKLGSVLKSSLPPNPPELGGFEGFGSPPELGDLGSGSS
jgi:tRNA threonylcarbamoyladenosine biosynthesis protein TsaE